MEEIEEQFEEKPERMPLWLIAIISVSLFLVLASVTFGILGSYGLLWTSTAVATHLESDVEAVELGYVWVCILPDDSLCYLDEFRISAEGTLFVDRYYVRDGRGGLYFMDKPLIINDCYIITPVEDVVR